MTANNCPFGRACCDGCNCLTTGGCVAKQNCLNTSQTFSITHDDMVTLWERRKDELMKLSKKELVEMIIGKKEHVGITFG